MEGWIGLYKTEGSSASFLLCCLEWFNISLRKAETNTNTNTSAKTMSNFRGCHALAMLLLLIFMLESHEAAGVDNPLFELSSRDEVVQMAGYGEEKLSTVLITGSVNCEAPYRSGDQPHAWPIPGI